MLLLLVSIQGAGVAAARVVDTSAPLQTSDVETTFFLDDGVLFGYSLATGDLWQASDPAERLQDPQISPDGTMFVAGPRPLHIGTLDGESFRRLSSVVFDATHYEWSRDSRSIYVRNRNSIDVVDAASGNFLDQVEVPGNSRFLGSTPDGFVYHEIGADGTVGDVVFYNASAAAEAQRVDTGDGWVFGLRSDGAEVYVRQGLQIFRLTVADAQLEHIVDLPMDTAAAFSPDGRYLLMRTELQRSATRVASTDHLRLLDTEIGGTIPILERDFIRISAMRWLPDSSGFILDHRDGVGSPNHRNHVSTSGVFSELDITGQVVGSAVVADVDKGPSIDVQWPAEDAEPAEQPVDESEPIDDGLERTATGRVIPAELLEPPAERVERLEDTIPRAFVEVERQLVEVSLSTGEHVVLASDDVGPWAASPDGRNVAYHTGLGGRAGHLHVLIGDTTRRLDLDGPAYATSGVAWGDDDTLFFDHAVGTDDRRIGMVTFDEGKPSEIAYLSQAGQSSFLLAAEGHRIVYFERVPLTGEDGVVVYDAAAQSVVARLPAVAIVEGTPASLSADGLVGSVRIGPSLFAWDLAIGEATVIEDNWRTVGSPRVAPDGKSIAYLMPSSGENVELIVYDVASAVSAPLGPAVGPISSFEWLPDSSGLLVTASRGSEGDIVHVDLEANRTALGFEGSVGNVGVGAAGVDGFSCDGANPLEDCASLLLGAPVGEAALSVQGDTEAEAGDSGEEEQRISEFTADVSDEDMAALLETLERDRAAQEFLLRVPARSTSYSQDGDSILDTRSGRRLVIGVPLMLIMWAVKAVRREGAN